jgi:hypothetical protein
VGESFDSAESGDQRAGELAVTAVVTVPGRLAEAMASYVRAARADNT